MTRFSSIILFFFSLTKLFSQWNLVNASTTKDLNSVHFSNSNIGYVVGEYSTILKTIDQGNTWIAQSYSVSLSLNSIHCSSNDTVFATRGLGLIRTYNGGNTWEFIQGGPNVPKSVYSISPKFVYWVGSFGGVYPMSAYSVQNGNNASDLNVCVTNTINNTLNSVFFIDTLKGYCCGEKTISKTTNGGISWTCLNNYNGNSIHFVNANIGYVAGDSGIVRKTINGGLTWLTQNTGTSNNLNSIYFATQDTGCAVGDWGTILGTIDGGLNWHLQYSPTINNLKSVYFTDRNNGYIVGAGGVILKNTNGPVGLKNETAKSDDLLIYPNPFCESINFKTNLSKGLVSVYDNKGINILNEKFSTESFNLDLSTLNIGVYFIKISTDNKVIFRKMVKI